VFLRDVLGGDEGPPAFRLAGRAWQVSHVDWKRGRCEVVPAEAGRVPTWMGQPTFLQGRLCAEMKQVLAEESAPAWLGPAAAAELNELRHDYAGLVEAGTTSIEEADDGIWWHTFAGGAVNRLLAEGLDVVGGGRWGAGNLSLRSRHAKSAAQAGELVERLQGLDWDEVAAQVAARVKHSLLSKFQICLPERLETKLIIARTVDVTGTKELLANTRIVLA
jgi:ATP-dependent Lhr-like helicase